MLKKVDNAIVSWMKSHGVKALRYSLAVVFIWFGFLKVIGASPANELVTKTVYWFDPSWFIPFLGYWEIIIGLCFLYRPLIRPGILLLALQMVGTFLPLIILPDVTFAGFLIPTLEGQYIIKNLVIIAAAIVIGSTVQRKNDKI